MTLEIQQVRPPRPPAAAQPSTAQLEVRHLMRQNFPAGVFLFDRRLGRGRHDGTIDIVAILPSGVWVIDLYADQGATVGLRRRRGVWSSSYQSLAVRGRDRTRLLDSLQRQAVAVEAALEAVELSGVLTRRAICFVDAEVGWRGHKDVGASHVTTPQRLVSLLRRGHKRLADADITTVGLSLEQHLPRGLPRL